MTDTTDGLVEGAIRDANLALKAIGDFDKEWKTFVQVCQTQQFDLAAMHGQRLVALVESAVDLFQSSNRRMAQFDRLTEGLGDDA